MDIRLAFPNEVEDILGLIEEARAFLATSGSDQWQGAYPSREIIIEDILEGRGHVALIEGKIVAYAAVVIGNEEAYNAIYDGKWKHDNYLYVTFHRIAVAD